MIRKFLFIILISAAVLCPVYCQAQAPDYTEINKTRRQLDYSGSDQQKTRLLIKLSRLFLINDLSTPLTDSAILYNDRAIALSTKRNDRPQLAEACLLRSHLAQIQHDYTQGKAFASDAITLYHELRNFDQEGEAYVLLWSNNALDGMAYDDRIPLLSKAAECFDRADNLCRQADCLREIGDLYHINGSFGKALSELKKSLELTRGNHCKGVFGTYDLLGVCYLILGDYQSAIQYGLLAIKTAEAEGEGDKLSMCTYYNRLGLSYVRADDMVNGKKYLDKAMTIAIKFNDPSSIAELALTNANLLLDDDKPQHALSFIKQILNKYPEIEKGHSLQFAGFFVSSYEALNLIYRATPFAQKIEQCIAADTLNQTQLVGALNHLIPYYIASNEQQKAQYYINTLYTTARRSDIPIFYVNYHLLQFRLDSAKGNYISAIRNYQQYNALKDSLSNEKKSMQINQLSILFDLEKKDRNIQMLTATSQLQQSNLKQAKLIQHIYSGGSLLLVIILLLLLYNFRIKQKANSLLRKQQQLIHTKNNELQSLLTEKEWLIKEIHHRVKNNLHMVAGLLSSQTEFLKGAEAMTAITSSQHRIEAVSLIHQRLYQSDNLSNTGMPSYIFDLTEYIRDAYGKSVIIQLDIAKIELSLAYSVPIGLILNEAVTNAIKYAFPDKRNGVIKIVLKELGTNEYLLRIEDNGTGLPADFDPDNCSSLGLNLMKGFSTDINGTFSIISNKGTKIEIIFFIKASQSFEI